MPTKFSVTDLLSSSLTSVTRGRHIIREMERKALNQLREGGNGKGGE